MSRLLTPMLLAATLALAAIQVSAFCIHNDSDRSLFFSVGDHGILYKKWVSSEAMSCCDWRQVNCNWTHLADGQLSVRVYEQRPNGVEAACSTQVRADGNLYLSRFDPQGQCQWQP